MPESHFFQQKQYLTLKASAGSGKTFALTVRYLSLLFLGVNPSEILTLTFTNKATEEMIERISSAIKMIAEDRDSKGYMEALCQEYGFSQEWLKQEGKKVYQRFISQTPQIKTIDAFFSSIVKKFCWYMGLPRNYEIQRLDKDQIRELFLQRLGALQKEALVNILSLEHLSLHQIFELSQYQDGMQKKLDVLRAQHPCCPQDLPALESWVAERVQTSAQEILDTTERLKAFVYAHSKASESAKKLFIPKKMILKEILSSRWLSRALDGESHRDLAKLEIPQEFFDSLSRSAKSYYDWVEYHRFITASLFIQSYQQSREQYYREAGLLDYDDVTRKTQELLCHTKDMDFFYFRLDARIKHILIDEFQDTSKIQYEILSPLIDEIRAGEGASRDRSLFFVGDFKQSIYGFRGANPHTFAEVESFTKTEDLPYNYRSSKVIVDFNNEYFSRLFQQGYVNQKLPPSKSQEGGYIRVYETCKVDEETSDKSLSDQVFLRVLESVKTLLDKNIKNITILCYKNDTAAALKLYLCARLQEEIPIFVGKSRLLGEMQEARALESCLLYANAQSQGDQNYHLANVKKILGLRLEDAISIPPTTGNLAQDLWNCMRHFKLCDQSAKAMLQLAFKHHELGDFLEELKNTEAPKQAQEAEGISIMTIHASKGLEFDHVIFCDRVSAQKNELPLILEAKGQIFSRQNKNKVREKLDPAYQRALELEEEKRQNEEKNVLYVAFTRAKKSLFIIPTSLALSAQERGELQASKEPSTPKIHKKISPVKIEDFGRQERVVQESSPMALSAQDAFFGEALHLAMEYSWFLNDEQLKIKILNRYGFYLQEESLESILSRKRSLFKQEHFLRLKVGTPHSEAVLFKDGELCRLDLMMLDSVRRQVVIVDYKSGRMQAEHIHQVKHYMDLMKLALRDYQVSGYVVYVWEKPCIKAV